MNRERFKRPAFDFNEYLNAASDEERNRLFWFWWTDEADRRQLLQQPEWQHLELPSRTPYVDDPAPPLSQPVMQGGRRPALRLLTNREDILHAIQDSENFSNAPYAALGGGSFLLAQDPVKQGTDWHAQQRALILAMLGTYTGKSSPASAPLRELARLSVRQAALTMLTGAAFDLAAFTEQAALRYMGALWGYGAQDHGLLEQGARQVYAALQYVTLAQHFLTDPALLPRARAALAALVSRTDELIDQYRQLARAPRLTGPEDRRDWPEGVQPWKALPYCGLGEPLLKRLSGASSELSGRDRAEIFATLLVGTVGNIVSAVCLCMDEWLTQTDAGTQPHWPVPGAGLADKVEQVLARRPPLPVLPRRTRGKQVKLPSGLVIDAQTDCLLALEVLDKQASPCPHAWGQTPAHSAVHACLGPGLAMPLIEEMLHYVSHLRLLRRALDPLTGSPLALERRWGFSVVSMPLLHDADRVPLQADRRQQPPQPPQPLEGLLLRPRVRNLIVAMRIKSPVAEHALALRHLIVAAVPRIDSVLVGFRNVRHAWFEFSEGDQHLVLRTLYEGDFDAYIYHFAVHAGDLFDRLFLHLEDAPLMPVAEHPDAFIETIRRFNRAPVGGYLYGA